jgi:signal transduction histidine kinase
MNSEPTAKEASPRGLARGELGLIALLAGLVALTLLTAVLPELRFAVLAPDIDLLINGLATLVASVAAWLSWLRYRHVADIPGVYQAAAFTIFSSTAGVQTLAALGIGEEALGLSLEQPRQAPLYAWALLRVLAGGLLLVAAWLRLARPAPRRRSSVIIGLALAVAAVGTPAVYLLEPVLPPLLSAEAFVRLAAPDALVGPLPGITLLELALQSIAVGLLGAAAAGYAIAARRGGSPSAIYLAAGVLIASFAQIHFALFPGIYSGLVTSSDLLRIFFYGFVVVGIQAEAGATLRDLRAANQQLRELRDVELANASLNERARLAREIHDGLAQHLWLAKLATERLTDQASPAEVVTVRDELATMLEGGLEEARRTVAALRDASHSNAPLPDALARHVRRFEESTGLTARLSCDIEPQSSISPRVSAELLRVAQEALNNVRKHADATLVSLELTGNARLLRLSVRDNGVGFDAAAADQSGFGLESMRQRAEAVGGRLVVQSAPLAGTTVVVEVPVTADQTRGMGGT